MELEAILPPYQTRISARAKHLQVKVCAPHGLEVVIPKNLKHIDVEDFLLSKRAWLIRHADLIARNHHANIKLPTAIDLRALMQVWQMDYQLSAAKPCVIERPVCQLVMLGNSQDITASTQCLRNWLRCQAQQHLVPHLEQLSQQCQLPFTNAQIRSQATRWGSCSADKTIQLNLQLLFVPPALARYVLIHELCHTVHMNHGKRFWALVKRFDPCYLEHRSQLRHADCWVPAWLRL